MLTARHWVKFTVMHVHVKPTAQRSSLLGMRCLLQERLQSTKLMFSVSFSFFEYPTGKMMSSSVEVADRTSLEVGVGFLPLMLNGESIIEDAEHQVSFWKWRWVILQCSVLVGICEIMIVTFRFHLF